MPSIRSLLSLFAVACAPPPEALPVTTTGPTEVGQSEYAYVLGADGDRSIVGGSHLVQRLDERREAYGRFNQPSAAHPDLVGDALFYDPALVSGATDWMVFPSSWWPMSEDGIAARWSDPAERSPAEKFDLLFFPDELEVVPEVTHWYYDEAQLPIDERPEPHTHPEVTAGPATAWELTHHGVYQSVHPDSWWGHCNGWASYAVADEGSYPDRGIYVSRVDGKLTECVEDRTDCVHFRRGDLEALLTEVWFNDAATFGGQRCDVRPEDIERDELGRPTNPACRDLNPGTFHVAVTQLLGVGGVHLATGLQGFPAVVIDHSADWEVWNFPLVGFEIVDAIDLTEPDAAALIGATGDGWPFNPDAVRFVRVRLVYSMVSDAVGGVELTRRADRREVPPYEVEVAYILELDADDRILGGEWVDDPSSVWGPDSMELHPDFLWIPIDPQGELEEPNDTGGSADNPLLSYRRARKLLDCANDPTTCAPEADPDPEPEPDPGDPDPEPSEPRGCGCASTGDPAVGWLAVGVALALVRRR